MSLQRTPKICEPHDRKTRRCALMLSAAAAAMLMASPTLGQTPPAANALPTGEVLAGSSAATFDRSVPNALGVTQTSSRAVIDWTSFDIGSDASVTFTQPNATSIALNRVDNGSPTQIHGALAANGIVGVLNPNGVYFDGSAQVNVGGLIATTGDIADQAAFLAGGALRFAGASTGDVVVATGASITSAGLAAFVAPRVANSGTITANAGRVVLAAGDTFTLDLGGDGLLALGLSSTDPLVENHGEIFARGGTIRLSAAAAAGVVGRIVNDGGLTVRSASTAPDGTVVLEGGNTTVELEGTYDADFRITNRLGLSGGLTLDGGGAAAINGRLAIVGHAPAGSVIDGVTIEGLTINARAGQVALIAESNSADSVYNTTNLAVRDVTVTMKGQHAIGLFDVNGAVFDNVVIHGDGSAFYGIEAIGLRNFTMTGGAIENTRTGVNVWSLGGYEENGSLAFSGVDFANNRTHLSLVGAGASLNALLAANAFDRTVHATGGAAIYGDLAFAVSDAAAGSTLNLSAGSHTLTSQLNIARPVTLRGESRAGTVINAAASGYGMFVTADDVTLSDFTFQANDTASTSSGRYGVKVQPVASDPANRLRRFSIENVTIAGFGGSELDLNAVTGATIHNLTLDGRGTKGVGLAITDSADVTASAITTRDNLWGAVALYQSNRWFDQRLNNITISAAGSSFGEPLGLFVQQESNLFAQHGQLNLTGFAYAVRNPNHRNGQTGFGGALTHPNDGIGGQFTFFRTTLSDATNFALNLNTAQARASSIESWTGTGYGNVFTVVNGLSIASALRDARGGATVNVGAGTYSDLLTLDKSLTLNGAGMGSTMLTGGLAMTGAIGGLTLRNFSVSGDGGGNMVIRNSGAITGLTMDRVRIDGLDVAGRHGFAGGTIGGAIAITNSEFLNIDGWAAFDTRSGAGADQGSQIASAKFSGNLLDDVQGHIVFRQDSTGAYPDVEFSNNVVRNTGAAANSFGAVFKAFNARTVSVTGNTVSGVGTSGFNPAGEAAYGAVLMVRGASTLTVSGNNFTGNRMVFAVEPNRALPTVTNFTNNSFVNNAYVLYTPGSLTGGGAVNFGAGNTITSGANTVQHIVWRGAGALDLTGVRFDGALASAMTLDQQFALERLITHGMDIAGAGLARTVAGKVFVTLSAGALARGVALASGGDTIHVADGAYSESVSSGKANLSLAFGTASVNGLALTGAGTRLSGRLTASGSLSFTDLGLNGAVALISDGGHIAAGAVSGPYAFSALARAGDVTVGALATGAVELSGRTVTTAGAATAGAQTYTGAAVRLAGTYATGGGAFTVSGPATLTGATAIASSGGAITLGAVDGAAPGAQALRLDAGTGRVTAGALGAATRLGDAAVTAADTTLAGGMYAANTLNFTGGPVRLTAALTTFDTRRSAGAAGGITVTGDLLGAANGAQNVVFLAGTGASPGDGDITIGNAGSSEVRLGAMSVTGRNFTAKTVKLAGDFTSVLSGDQVFSSQTLDTLGGVSNKIAGSASGPIVSGGEVTIDAGGSTSSAITAGGGVAITAGGSSSGAIQSGGGVTIAAGGETSSAITASGGVSVSAGGSISGPINSGGGVSITAGGGTSGLISAVGDVAIIAGGPVSNTINTTRGVDIDAAGPIVASVTTTGVVALKSALRVDADVTGGQVRVSAPEGSIKGNFASLDTGQGGAFVVNEQKVTNGGVDARRVMIDEVTVPERGASGEGRPVRRVMTVAGAEAGEGRRATVGVGQVDDLGELLRRGYDSIVVQVSGPAPDTDEDDDDTADEAES